MTLKTVQKAEDIQPIMCEIVLDTETTGLNPHEGHRLVEIGCLELINHRPTGNIFHTYLDPMRDIPAEAIEVHGLTTEFLQGHPSFSQKADDFIDFIGDSVLVIHNAEFDISFLNAELKSIGMKPLSMSRVIDTLQMARKKFPDQPNNLAVLCERFKINTFGHKGHPALTDAELTAKVYLNLIDRY